MRTDEVLGTRVVWHSSPWLAPGRSLAFMVVGLAKVDTSRVDLAAVSSGINSSFNTF